MDFERYADDAVVHCVSERQARKVWAALSERMASVGLRLHPDKTKIVYCRDEKRRSDYPSTSFTFLGFTFRPRSAAARDRKSSFTGFLPAMSTDALKVKSQTVRKWRLHLRTTRDLNELAQWMNPIIRGWMDYYGTFYRSEIRGLLQRINTYLVRWARRKFRRLRSLKKAKRWWQQLVRREPKLFVHWKWVTDF